MDTARDIAIKIKIIKNIFDQAVNRAVGPVGLTAAQSLMLQHIARASGGSVFQRDMENTFGLKHPTVTGIVNRLESKKLIICTTDDRDKRRKRIAPTDRGLRLTDEIRGDMDRTGENLLRGFSAEETALLSGLLDRMIRNTPHDLCPPCGFCGKEETK